MNKLKCSHFFSLPSQANIYTFSNLQLINGTNKLLVATLKREVFCFEFIETNGTLVPTVKEISFTYIPSGAEIISMDVFNKSDDNNEFVIGITIIKKSSESNSLETYLNIYSESEDSNQFNIESIAQNCLNVELNFIPYHLTHTFLVSWKGDEIAAKEIVFILTGSDNQIHIYKENSTSHSYKETERKELFPEFNKPPSVVVWIDTIYINNYSERVTAFGCECGYLRVCKVNTKSNEILLNHSTRFTTPITCLRLYREKDFIPKPKELTSVDLDVKECKNIVNLVVVNSILPATYFADVMKFGITKCGPLPRVDMTNVFTCAEIADIDFDGEKEILIGNSTQELYVYKFKKDRGWCLTDLKKVAFPIFGVKYVDLTGDGVKELIVLTMKGVYVFQHDFKDLQRIIEEKIKRLQK